ncbi:hypothetical protein Dfri01_06540 [Dyadobacter frigoris]|nr:hypothetical protein Dfri01_06540 [Dyadobacter frigoris]
MKDVNWFKKEVEPGLKGYEVKYKFFEKGDFGSLNQVEFNSESQGGEIDFWSTGWLGIHLVDYEKGEELLKGFLDPHQEKEKEQILKKLQELLK